MNRDSDSKKEEEITFDTISNYWEDKHPGRKIGGNTPFEDYSSFFEKIDNYKYHRNHYQYLKEGVAEFDQHAGKKLLEIGCGLGADLGSFALGGAIVHAIESVNSAEETLRKRFELLKKEFKFDKADFKNIPYPDNYFDVVYSFGVLHHSPWIADGISEIHRVLKPDGKVIVMLYHKGFKYYIRKLFWSGIIKGQFLKYTTQQIINKNTEEFGDSPTTFVYNRKEAQELFSSKFKEAEIDVYRFDDYLKLPFNIKWYVFRSILPHSWYRVIEKKMGWNLILKAKKVAKNND
jgi:ubiquinone/menaquinone biosynthesis C-methylase UbiE